MTSAVSQQQLVQREHRKETVRSKRKEQAALLAGGIMAAPSAADEEEEGPVKAQVISYCALDYPRIVDSVQLRLEKVQRALNVSGGWNWDPLLLMGKFVHEFVYVPCGLPSSAAWT